MGTTTASIALTKTVATAIPTKALTIAVPTVVATAVSQPNSLTQSASTAFADTIFKGEFWANSLMQIIIAALTVFAAYWLYKMEQKSKKEDEEGQAVNLIEGLKTTLLNIADTVKSFNRATAEQGAVILYDQITFFDNASLLAIADVKYHLLNKCPWFMPQYLTQEKPLERLTEQPACLNRPSKVSTTSLETKQVQQVSWTMLSRPLGFCF